MNSAHPLDPDLTRPSQNGVYFVDDGDLARFAAAASRDELAVCRTDLAGCADKAGLLQRLAASLSLPADFGHNWDALADCLRDLGWLPGWGHVLLFAHAGDLQRDAVQDFDVLLGMLDDAATFAQDADRPFFAFLACAFVHVGGSQAGGHPWPHS
ncbi:barstar family protein [Rhodanobacter sp. DHB23]|uniref:barstar family protein n=1 Tax=Rhodanobacter sp. DHB23 TaxID=2775923 RepID=UPI00177C4153|nr:barstar family protein [Rhodanobacter sp. DHB23]MBD8874043.1 barstar family protein [Rhodanobacter sp. DHB23]